MGCGTRGSQNSIYGIVFNLSPLKPNSGHEAIVFYSFKVSNRGLHLTWDTAGWVSDSDEVEQ